MSVLYDQPRNGHYERVLPMLAEPAGGVISPVPSSGAARVYPKAPIRISAADSVKIGAHNRYMMK
jgi:hypothetical protein